MDTPLLSLPYSPPHEGAELQSGGLGELTQQQDYFSTLCNEVPFLCNSKTSSLCMSYEKHFLKSEERIWAHLSSQFLA